MAKQTYVCGICGMRYTAKKGADACEVSCSGTYNNIQFHSRAMQSLTRFTAVQKYVPKRPDAGQEEKQE